METGSIPAVLIKPASSACQTSLGQKHQRQNNYEPNHENKDLIKDPHDSREGQPEGGLDFLA